MANTNYRSDHFYLNCTNLLSGVVEIRLYSYHYAMFDDLVIKL